MTNLAQLEKRAEIEMARLGVAEDFGWGVSGFAGLASYLRWQSWLIAVAVCVFGYFLITHSYRKRETDASDAYERAAGLGKYYRPPPESNDGA